MGDRHRRAPDRGRQLEQRLVGVGAHARARAASSRAATPATRGTGGPRTSPCRAALGFDNYRFSIEWSRIEPEEGEWSLAAIDHYRRAVRRVARSRRRSGRDVPPLHDAAVARGQGRLDRTGDGRPFAASASAPPASWLASMRRALHDQRAERRVDDGTPRGRVPAGLAGRRAAPRRSTACSSTPTSKAVDAIRSAAPGVPVGLTLSMSDYQAVDGGESKRDQIRRRMEDEFLEGTDGDDFFGVQTYSRTRVGPDGGIGNEEGHDRAADGLRVLAAVARGARSGGRGR